MWKTCVDASAKSTSISSISPSGADGTAKKQSRTSGSSPGSASRTKPPPAGPVSGPSVTKAANVAASAASTHVPPSPSAHAPASAECRFPAAIAPLMERAYDLGDTRRPAAGRGGLVRQRRKLGSSRSASEPERPPGS